MPQKSSYAFLSKFSRTLRVNSRTLILYLKCAFRLEALKKNPLTDARHIAAIGYCFGGTAILELARSGVDIAGFISFHGGLQTPTPDDARNIKGKVLVLHGADDPVVPPEEVSAFQDEMRKARVDWHMISYGGAVHSFTNPNAGDDPSKGVAYNHKADMRSWQAMQSFFEEIFAGKQLLRPRPFASDEDL